MPEGVYTLRVEAGDAKGNASGEEPYEIRFQVQYSATVIATPPYPNPFYLDTHFDIVVTGDEPSGYSFNLEIFTLSGTVVHEFSDGEPGLHIGKNSFRWNGTDVAGDRLPDGIYLYRLSVEGRAGQHVYFGKVALLR